MSAYNPQEIEKKWQKFWKENQTFKTRTPLSEGEGSGVRLPKFFALDMFPYPSGAGLHVGHPLGYIATDIVSRFKRLKGFNVLHPMGYDSFGLPAEQYAIQTGQHPDITTRENINRYREQLDNLGFSYDWDREVRTSDPSYYKWTQWIFIQIFNSWYNKETDKAEPIDSLIEKFEKAGNKTVKAVCDDGTPIFTAEQWNNYSDNEKHAITLKYRLAYRANAFVNWCPGLGTVLANEEVKDGVSERGGFPVVRKEMPQWQLRITAYAERLINDLDLVDWPEPIKEQQRNWIGKSKGCMVTFQIDVPSLDPTPTPPQKEGLLAIDVFTTRVDTLFGVTYVTLAPEHELIDKITTPEQKEAVAKYVYYAKNRSERDRQSDVKTISGEFTGAYAINPFNNEKVPIWIGEYVLAGYGTGAVMAVSSSDFRDYNFAKHFNLPIISVQEGNHTDITKEDFDPKAGTMINSGFLNGMAVKDAIDAAIKKVEELGVGYGKVNFRIRDSIFSRQRYWGEPIPIYYKDGLPHSLPESELPLLLPEVDKFLPTEDGEPPLARAKDWVYKPKLDGRKEKNLVQSSNVVGYGVPLPTGEGLGVGSVDESGFNWQTTSANKWKSLKESARELRKNQTDAEDLLWQELRGEKLGYKIRRQQVIETFIVDFVSLEKKIVIEVDGGIHLDSEVKQFDEYRTKVLNHLGYKVIRFSNEEVETNIESVLDTIKKQLRESQTQPHPQPLPRGEGSFPLETNTMPGWAGSSWYFFRYMDNTNSEAFASKEALAYWQDVDLYLGGSEHATGHLLYSRFWTKFLYDLGYVNVKEYAKKLINQGMIQGRSSFVYRVNSHSRPNFKVEEKSVGEVSPSPLERGSGGEVFEGQAVFVSFNLKNQYEITPIHVDVNIVENDILNIEKFKNSRQEYKNAQFILEDKNGKVLPFGEDLGGAYICGFEVEKMSKSKLNVVNPDDIVDKYGADTLRLYEMFLGPLEMSKPWNTNSISGVSRFLRNVWKLFYDENGNWLVIDETPTDKELKTLHKTIKKVEEDIERFSFNTSVSTFMVCVNELAELKCHKKSVLKDFLVLLSPYAPHIVEELWEHTDNHFAEKTPSPSSDSAKSEQNKGCKFPSFNEKYLVENTFEYPISINGKVRHKMVFALNEATQEIEKQAIASAEIQKWLEGKAPKKVIVVPGKIINVVP